uniref:CCHC-type domain-containing protein n=1 Tax=Leptobrachium leishanense TaxID=445787 RepID=A0A8C5PLN4_9ANUR
MGQALPCLLLPNSPTLPSFPLTFPNYPLKYIKYNFQKNVSAAAAAKITAGPASQLQNKNVIPTVPHSAAAGAISATVIQSSAIDGEFGYTCTPGSNIVSPLINLGDPPSTMDGMSGRDEQYVAVAGGGSAAGGVAAAGAAATAGCVAVVEGGPPAAGAPVVGGGAAVGGGPGAGGGGYIRRWVPLGWSWSPDPTTGRALSGCWGTVRCLGTGATPLNRQWPASAGPLSPAPPGARRRNVVRLVKGGEEPVPDRRAVVAWLKDMGFLPVDLYALIHLGDAREFDVSFLTPQLLDRFWAGWDAARMVKDSVWEGFSAVPVSRQGVKRVTFLTGNESIPIADILVWARRYGEVKTTPQKILDEDGIWTGGWTLTLQLREIWGVAQHLPTSFFIGADRVICFYAGQPRVCFKCGSPRHFSNACEVLRCTLCGAVGHLRDRCGHIRCNLCRELGHAYRSCPYKDLPHLRFLPQGPPAGHLCPGDAPGHAGGPAPCEERMEMGALLLLPGHRGIRGGGHPFPGRRGGISAGG